MSDYTGTATLTPDAAASAVTVQLQRALTAAVAPDPSYLSKTALAASFSPQHGVTPVTTGAGA